MLPPPIDVIVDTNYIGDTNYEGKDETMKITGPTFFKTANDACNWLLENGYSYYKTLGIWIADDGSEVRFGSSRNGYSVSPA